MWQRPLPTTTARLLCRLGPFEHTFARLCEDPSMPEIAWDSTCAPAALALARAPSSPWHRLLLAATMPWIPALSAAGEPLVPIDHCILRHGWGPEVNLFEPRGQFGSRLQGGKDRMGQRRQLSARVWADLSGPCCGALHLHLPVKGASTCGLLGSIPKICTIA